MALTDKQRKWRNDWERGKPLPTSCKVHKDYAAHAKQVVAENGDTVSGVLKRQWTPTWRSMVSHLPNQKDEKSPGGIPLRAIFVNRRALLTNFVDTSVDKKLT